MKNKNQKIKYKKQKKIEKIINTKITNKIMKKK